VRLLRRGDAPPTLDLLAVGLGNPGREYRDTRHNVGFMVVDELARRHDADFRSKFSGLVADLRIQGRRVALLEPQTFMNDSGRSVAAAARFYKVPFPALLVVHDEVDLVEGRLQIRLGGGLAGHNGLRSIARQLGSPDFLRLRIGVGRPERGDPRPVADFVLSPFEPEVDVEEIVGRAADAVEVLVVDGAEAAQQRFNERP
jgi:PTH1 family peptidyl-tRNA hydrolase